MNTTATSIPTVENGATVFIPFNKLKKHPKNARKTPAQRGVYRGEGREHRRQGHTAKSGGGAGT